MVTIQDRAKNAAFRARKNWILNSDKPTKYFLSLEKQNFNKKTLYRIETEDGCVKEEPAEVLQEIRNYYQKLYTSTGHHSDLYVKNIDIPQIDKVDREMLDQDITMDEVGVALRNLDNNKQPGTDGIPPDFYKMFWGKIKVFMFEVYKEIVADKAFHLTARRGVLSLLEKSKKNSLQLRQWRPLTILNGDNKIFTKLLANRLESVLPKIIHHSQTGFMKGRQLSENIMKILEVMSQTEMRQTNGLLVSFDFLKAFDTVEWSSVFTAFRSFGFGEKFLDLISIVYNKPALAAINNGYWSEFFEATRGNRQGCCFSPCCFIVLVELLGIGIRQNPNIVGIRVGDTEVKSGQFADDLWATLQDAESLNAMLIELDKFYRFSGLRLNAEKSVILKIGPHKNSDAKFFTLKKLFWSPKAIKILGIWLYPSKLVMYIDNFVDTLDKVKDIIDSWSNRRLSLNGKIVVINTLINTLFIHKFLALPAPPKEFFKIYKGIILEFLWDGKPAKIKYDRLIQNYDKLGLKLVDLYTKSIALKAAWPLRWAERQESELTWFYQALPIKDRRMWYCNINPKDVKSLSSNSDTSYSTTLDILMAWSIVNYKPAISHPEDILSSVLWGNSLIRRRNKPLFDKNMVNSNVFYVLDIYDLGRNRFLDYNELVDNFGYDWDLLTYLGIRAAIPDRWKLELRNCNVDREFEILGNFDILAKSKSYSKRMYWDLLNETYPQNLSLKFIWEKELKCNLTDEEWWRLYPEFLRAVKPSKLRLLQYRLLTRSLTLNVLRHKWDVNVSPLCTFCKSEKETLFHFFWQCKVVEDLWTKVVRMFKHFFKLNLNLDVITIYFNNYKGKHKKIVNFVLAATKQYIYATKCLGETLDFKKLMSKLSEWYYVDKAIAYEQNKVTLFTKKWQCIFD